MLRKPGVLRDTIVVLGTMLTDDPMNKEEAYFAG
jgi:hypothetical protein